MVHFCFGPITTAPSFFYYIQIKSQKKNYSHYFIVTKNVIKATTGAFHVKGKHSYRGQYIILYGRKTHSNVDFKADVTPTNSGLKVKFWKWYEPDVLDPKGHWEGPCEKTIIP